MKLKKKNLLKFAKTTMVDSLIKATFTKQQSEVLFDIFWSWIDEDFLEKRFKRIEKILEKIYYNKRKK